MSSSSPSRLSQDETPHIEPQALVSHYTTRLLQPLRGLLPSSFGSPRLLNWLWSFYTRGSPARTRRRKPGLPIPLPPGILASLPAASEAAEVAHLLDDVLDHVLSSLHKIQKSLQFWQSRAEGSDAKKIYFMVFERGPRAFIKESVQLISRYRTQGYTMQSISQSAAVSFSNKITVLTRLQYHLATFIAQIYLEIDRYGELLANDPAKALPALTLAIARLFSNLEDSMRGSGELLKNDPSTVADELGPCDAFSFVNLPDHLYETSSWSHSEVRDAVYLIYQNLQKLDSHISLLVSKCQKPRRMTLYWLRYTCGAVGLSACTIWLLRHSSLMGSSDIDNWIREAKESTAGFWRSHVEQPVIAIRDELFETFRRRHKGVIEVEEVKLTEDSLHRMLLVFCEQTKSQKFPENASDQEMLEIVMSRYEKEVMHPIQNLFGGEIARALLIQIQKLKLDLETAMLELDQILKANEINFAILAALPAFFLSVFFLMLARAWILQDKGAEGRGKLARLQRRLLVAEVEKRIMRLETCIEERQEEDAQCMFGLVLYSLDRLYKAVERHAKEAGEWQSLKQDILDIGNPRIRTREQSGSTGKLSPCPSPSPSPSPLPRRDVLDCRTPELQVRASLQTGVGASPAESHTGSRTDGSNGGGRIGNKPFDLFLRPSLSALSLQPSLFAKNKERKAQEEKARSGPGHQILRPGMVLLKNYLSHDIQVDILTRCRNLGLGPGGFYRPGYRDGAKLSLQMMCLGKNWDPETKRYEEIRSYDGAVPPAIPEDFKELVAEAMGTAHRLIREKRRKGSGEEELPGLSPDLCIVNFYLTNGKLGLHQDRDESEDSLCRGLPVVSFSIGASAIFEYGDSRTDTHKLELESGDILIFGGKSRHIFHGVTAIKENTALKRLIEETYLRPGRLNLTFRQF